MTATIAPYEDLDARRTRRLLTIGKRVSIVGLALALIGGAMLATGVFQAINDISHKRDDLIVEVPVAASAEVALEPGSYNVVAIGTGLLEHTRTRDGDRETRRTDVPVPTITITDSAGTPVTSTGSNTSFHFSNDSYDLVSMGSFRVDTADTYRMEVDGEPGAIQSIGIDAGGTHGAALALGGGALLALGLMVTIGGIATYVNGYFRRRRQDQARNPMLGWAPPPGFTPSGGPYRGPHGGSALPPPPPPPSAPSSVGDPTG